METSKFSVELRKIEEKDNVKVVVLHSPEFCSRAENSLHENCPNTE